MKRDTEIENVRIASTSLGREAHGILTCFLRLEGDGWGVGFGGYALDAWDEARKRRVGTDYGCEYLLRVMDVLGVEKWEDVKGQMCRVESEGLGGRALRIGHITKNRWFDPEAFTQEYRKAEVGA